MSHVSKSVLVSYFPHMKTVSEEFNSNILDFFRLVLSSPKAIYISRQLAKIFFG